MYSQNMIRIYRSPEGGEGGGTMDNGGAPSGDPGAAAGAGAAEGGTAGGSSPQYVSKTDFDAFANEMRQGFSRFNRPAAEPKPKADDSPKELKRPNPRDYDFKADPEALQRYEDDLDEYRYQVRKGKEAKEREESDKKTALETNERGHLQRVSEYKKANPAFDADAQKAGNIQVFDEVKHAIYASKNSPAILHYLFQNPQSAEDLNLLMQTEGLDAVREQIGEFAAAMRQKKEQIGNAEAAARVRPPRQNLRGGAPAGTRKLSPAERYERFQE